MTQRTFERVRRIELQLGIEPSHYERGSSAAPAAGGASQDAPARARIAPGDGDEREGHEVVSL
jgi:hypothetical protein